VSASNRSNSLPQFTEIDGLGLLAVAALSALFYFVGIGPLLEHQKAAAAQQQELQMKQIAAAAAATDLQTANARLADQRKLIADNPLKLQSLADLNNRLARITALATAGGLDIANLHPQAPIDGTQYATVPMELAGTGGFADCVRYLHDLHEQLPDTTCTAVRLSGSADTPAPAHFIFELNWHAASQGIAAMPTQEN
jgi:Tfp pilus assembly protein PilO